MMHYVVVDVEGCHTDILEQNVIGDSHPKLQRGNLLTVEQDFKVVVPGLQDEMLDDNSVQISTIGEVSPSRPAHKAEQLAEHSEPYDLCAYLVLVALAPTRLGEKATRQQRC